MSDTDPNESHNADPRAVLAPEPPTEPARGRGPAPDADPLLSQYRRTPGWFDECLTEKGAVRPPYAALLQSLKLTGPGELKRRWENSRRLVHEQGIAYNVYGDARGLERPWQLDPVPLVIAPDEWRGLEAALVQRATLLNRILADCHGQQDLIRSGWLPPALVFAQPDFQQPCHGIRPVRGTFLNFYAADLARSPDGRWWVTSDRTQIPTGAGYALANRLVTSRVLPESFHDCRVQRLAGFFRDTQKSLAQLAPPGTDNPRVVLLTPGPYNETYFEQAYLARYLGYALVEGQDLTVRDDRVFLKTLSGLERVDVILRRVDDEFCDPLELRNDSILGVPGLVEAARAGNVSIANPLGSSLVQSPAFLAFLPGLCRHVLREELKLPSAATWWCGQKTAEKHVLEHLGELYVKPAFRSRVQGMKPGQKMTAAERAELARRIRFQPHEFVAQEWVELSTAPALGADAVSLLPRRVTLRVYLVATENGYSVMPGGLTRVAPAGEGHSVSLQKDGASKDTWVLSDAPVPDISLLEPSGQVIDLRRTGNNLPSRMADNFFWLGRYTERADSATRLLRSVLLRFSPERGGGGMPFLTPLLEALERQGQLPRHRRAPGGQGQSQSQGQVAVPWPTNPEALEAELLAAIFDPVREGSLHRIAEHLQRLAMFIRDRTSTDLWRALHHLGGPLTPPPAGTVLLAADALNALNQTILGLAAFHGLARENMTRAQGWRFLDMGWRMERAVCLCTFLDCALRSPEADNPSLLEAVLEVADSTITYRSRYNLLPHIVAVYDLVLLDDKNPRSLFFQLEQLVKHFDRLPREHSNSALQELLRECVRRVRILDPRELGGLSGNWHQSETGRVVQSVLEDMPELSNAIAAAYFAHSEISRTGGGLRP
jgi:uncharacterized circularly permuted ATP-grasp superfamily protein/uncharacterized alpha-E superfamily protein